MRVLIFGGSGLVGSQFIEINKDRVNIHSPDISETDILNKNEVLKAAADFKADFIINFAAFTDVQEAQQQKDDEGGSCYQVNVTGAKNIAQVCKEFDIRLIHISTDYVFDGNKPAAAYKEEDSPNPLNWYGKTKYLAEKVVQDSGCTFVIVRISMPFSSHYDLKVDVARFFLGQLRKNLEIKAITDQKVTPVFVDDVANALYEIIKKDVSGIYHVVSTGWMSPFEFSQLIAQAFNLDEELIKPITLDEYNQDKKAKLLRYSWLDCSKFVGEFGNDILHSVKESINLFKKKIDLKTNN